MARVTVEDCVTKIPNRFELVMLAAQRARDISAGAELTVEDDDDRNPVIALREIAEETVTRTGLTDSLLRGLQRHAEIDEPDDSPVQLPASEEAMLSAEGAAEAAFAAQLAAAAADAPDPGVAPDDKD